MFCDPVDLTGDEVDGNVFYFFGRDASINGSCLDFSAFQDHGAGLAEPQVVSLAAGAAMMWRAVVLWLVLLLLLSLAGWLG